MAVTALVYGAFPGQALNKEIDFLTDTVRVALLDNTHVPDQDAHDYFSDVVADEVTGTGYTAGGEALANKAATYTAGTNVLKLDADDVIWADSTITARYAVVYVDTGVDTTSALICLVDFGADVSSTAAAFTVAWNAAGILTVTVT